MRKIFSRCLVANPPLVANEKWMKEDGEKKVNASLYYIGWKSFVPNCYEARHHVCSKFLIQIYAKPKPNEFWSSKKSMKILARDYWLWNF
jgi:hypothetical protein